MTDDLLARLPLGAVRVGPDGAVIFMNEAARSILGGTPELPPELAALLGRQPIEPQTVELASGRVLRVSGVDDLLFLDDMTERRLNDHAARAFFRGAAHQLRTPLTGIIAGVQTLQSGAKLDPVERDRFLGHIEAHADRLSRVAQALLRLSRAQVGVPVAKESIDVARLFADLVAEAVTKPGVALRVECPPSLQVSAAWDLLYEAIAVLVDNAVTHTQSGEVLLAATRRGSTVVITVADDGPGIPAADRERIFEPFVRLEASGTGTGLGLAIAKESVAAMDGTIEVSGRRPRGTVFTVRLPAR